MKALFSISSAAAGGASSRRSALAAATVSNQDIVTAAQNAYGAHQTLVDALTSCAVGLYLSPDMQPAIRAIDAYDWTSGKVSPELVRPLLSTSAVRAYLAQLTDAGGFSSLLTGVSGESLGAAGNTAMGADLQGDVASFNTLALPNDPFTPKAEPTQLALSIWTPAPAEINAEVYGLELGATIQGTPVLLRILLTEDLAPYGFISGVGLTSTAPHGATVLGGTATAS